MSDSTAIIFYACVVYAAFIGAVALPRRSPVTRGSMRLLAVAFVVLVIESYRVGPL